jgi:hypothetical protein
MRAKASSNAPRVAGRVEMFGEFVAGGRMRNAITNLRVDGQPLLIATGDPVRILPDTPGRRSAGRTDLGGGRR